MKYFIESREKSRYFSYRLMCGEQVYIEKTNQVCFSDVTYGSIDPSVSHFVAFQEKEIVPYYDKEISRWCKDLRELGFPVQESKTLKFREFTVAISDFISKVHFNSTLQLIRCLYENDGISRIPARYFDMIDADPNRDKLEAMQLAMKVGYFNYNHTPTSQHTPGTIDKETLFTRFKECLVGTRESNQYSQSCSVTDCWYKDHSKPYAST